MVAEVEGLSDNTEEVIVLFKKNDVILARFLRGHEMLYLSLCAWWNDLMEFRSAVEKLCLQNGEQHTQRDLLVHWTLTGHLEEPEESPLTSGKRQCDLVLCHTPTQSLGTYLSHYT